MQLQPKCPNDLKDCIEAGATIAGKRLLKPGSGLISLDDIQGNVVGADAWPLGYSYTGKLIQPWPSITNVFI